MLTAYATVLVFGLVAVGFVFASLVASRVARIRQRPDTSGEKLATYESGEAPFMPAWFNFNPRFYLVALVFLVFDVEVAFVYPVAVVFRRWVEQGHAGRAAIELFAFVAVLLLALAYVWKKGDLEWVRAFGPTRASPAGPTLDVARSRAGEPVRSEYPPERGSAS
jgi:NADH-quinone oxidoreductase subunit A